MRRDVTVTVADSHRTDPDAVARRLELAGMQVEQILTVVGIITGSVAEEQIAALEAVEGVAAIERQTGFQLPPPDAEVQ
jgi:precorrin-6B methylase 2